MGLVPAVSADVAAGQAESASFSWDSRWKHVLTLQGVRRSRDTGLLPATSGDIDAGTVQATREESAGGTQLGRVTDHRVSACIPCGLTDHMIDHQANICTASGFSCLCCDGVRSMAKSGAAAVL